MIRALAGLGRLWHSPLRRPTDLAEAWAVLLAVVLIAVGAPVAAWAAGGAAHDSLERTVREQREQRRLVTATVLRALPHPPLDPDPETSSARDAHRRVVARWTAPDGSVHTGAVGTGRAVVPGDRFRLWTDVRGRTVSRPMDSSTAASHAVLAGAGAGAAVVVAVEGARRFVVWRLLRRRYQEWELAWRRAGQDWGRTGAGS